MKKFILSAVILLAGFGLGACSGGSKSSATPTVSTPAVTQQKVGDTTKVGKIVKLGEKYAIQETGKQPAEIDSYGVDLSGYVGQKVSITGQYSGDTLFVSKVEVQ